MSNLFQSSGFVIISILHVLYQNILLRDCLFEFISKIKNKNDDSFPSFEFNHSIFLDKSFRGTTQTWH